MTSVQNQAVLGESAETGKRNMPTNEEGEFELVLGNKQLLSVFFLIVLLLGVFFSMGYIVGRNTAPAGSQLASNRPSSGTLTVEPPVSPAVNPDLNKPSPVGRSSEPPAPPPSQTSTPERKPEAVKPEPVKPEPKPEAKPEPKPEPKPERKREPVTEAKKQPEPPKPEPPKKEPPAPKPAETAKAAPVAKGNYYLQVAAVREKDAEILKEVLGKRGFSTATEPVPEKALVRVLVGPFRDSDSMNQAKEKLSDFKPIPRKM